MTMIRPIAPCLPSPFATTPLYLHTTSTRTRTRGIHLLHHMFVRDNPEKMIMVRKKSLPDASEVTLNLLSARGSHSVPMTLANVLPLITPFHHLAQTDPQARIYRIVALKPAIRNLPPSVDDFPLREETSPSPSPFKHAGRSREFHLITLTPPTYFT